MDRLHRIEEYKVLLREVKQAHMAVFSNLYVTPRDIERYISLGRVEYEKKEEGVYFYFDEETYYRVCMCVEVGGAFNISKRGKKLLVRNMYRENKQDEKLAKFEKDLEKNGLNRVGTTFQIQAKTEELWQNCSHLEKYALSMEKKGFHCIEADHSLYDEIEKLILDSNVIKDYHMTYYTEQEKQMMIGGSYLCILDKQNQICAAGILYVSDGVARDGVVAVKEEYKMKGITPLLSYHRIKWFRMNKINLAQGWIRTDNDASIKYHMSLGYQSTGRYANEWIMQKKDTPSVL